MTQPVVPYVARTRVGGSTTAIVTWRGEDFVEAVMMSSGLLDVTRFDIRDFDVRFEPYEYDAVRAAVIYLKDRKPETGMTAAASEVLSNIINHIQGAAGMTKTKPKTTTKSTAGSSISKEMREKMNAVGKGAAVINRKAKADAAANKTGKITPTASAVPPAKPIKHAPAGAPTKPEKTARAPKVKGEPSARLKLDLTAKITVVSKENPKREGSGANKRFALYKTGMTVGEFLKAGGIPPDVHWDSKQNFIKLGK